MDDSPDHDAGRPDIRSDDSGRADNDRLGRGQIPRYLAIEVDRPVEFAGPGQGVVSLPGSHLSWFGRPPWPHSGESHLVSYVDLMTNGEVISPDRGGSRFADSEWFRIQIRGHGPLPASASQTSPSLSLGRRGVVSGARRRLS